MIEHLTARDGKIIELCTQSSFLRPLISSNADELRTILLDMDSNQDASITKEELNVFMEAAIKVRKKHTPCEYQYISVYISITTDFVSRFILCFIYICNNFNTILFSNSF